jgi:hypothetical protein
MEHQGAANSKRWHLLPFKAKVDPIGIPPEEAQFIQTRDHQIVEICQLVDVPPSRIHYMKDAKWANVEQENINYVVYSLMNWAVAWEQEIDYKFFSNSGGGIFSKHNFRALLRGDSAAQSNFLRTMTQSGIYSINQALEYLDEDPVDGGDRHYIAMNQMPIDATPEELAILKKQQPTNEPAQANPEPDKDNPPRADYSAVADDILTRLKNKGIKATANAQKKYAESENDFIKWQAAFDIEQRKYMADMITPIFKALGMNLENIPVIVDKIFETNDTKKLETLAGILNGGKHE